MIILRQKQYTRAEKEAMFQLMRLTKGFKSLPKELNSVENATRFKKFSNRLKNFAKDPEVNKLSAEDLKEMKGFLNDIGATKLADNFEPIVNKYYGNNNIDAWKRLRLREEKLPAKAIESRKNRLTNRSTDFTNSLAEVESYSNNLKSVKGKSDKEIFSSPDGKLMKSIIEGETGGIDRPSLFFRNTKGIRKMSNRNVNLNERDYKSWTGEGYSKKEREARKKSLMKDLFNNEKYDCNHFTTFGEDRRVILKSANPNALSHELGHSKSYELFGENPTISFLRTPLASNTSKYKRIIEGNKRSGDLVAKRWGGIYDRAAFHLPQIAEENMANAYGRDIIRKYGRKNVDKHLANYEKMVDNINMKSYLAAAKADGLNKEVEILDKLKDKIQ